jgi:hypothetical protein
MPSEAYLKNKPYILKWNALHKDKVREWARNLKRRKDSYSKEWKALCNIQL